MNKNLLPHKYFFLFILNIISADPSSGQWKQFVYTDGLSAIIFLMLKKIVTTVSG